MELYCHQIASKFSLAQVRTVFHGVCDVLQLQFAPGSVFGLLNRLFDAYLLQIHRHVAARGGTEMHVAARGAHVSVW